MFGGGMMNGFGSLGLIGWILNLVIALGLIVGIVLLVIWLVRRVGVDAGGAPGTRQQAGPLSTPREILQTRYARGEITREQYQQMLQDLG